MKPARAPRWLMPLTVLAVDSVLLFGAVGVGLSVPGLSALPDIGGAGGLGYASVLSTRIPTLTDAFLGESKRPDPARAAPALPAGGSSGSVGAARCDPVCGGVHEPPDDFAEAREVEGLPFRSTTQMTGASREPGEPADCGVSDTGGTLWYRLRPRVSAVLTAHTLDTREWVSLGVYRGTNLRDLRLAACDDDPEGRTQVKLATFRGETLYFQITSTSSRGELRFAVLEAPQGVTSRISVTPGGGETDDASWEPSISRNGRFVAFQSAASNIDPNGNHRCAWLTAANIEYPAQGVSTRSCPDIFFVDRQDGVPRLVTRGWDGRPADGASWMPHVSGSGRWVTFVSEAGNLIRGLQEPCPAGADQPATVVCGNVFRWDRLTGELRLITRTIDGAPPNGLVDHPTVSDDGRFVAFESMASNLAANDSRGYPPVIGLTGKPEQPQDVFVHDVKTGRTELVSVSRDGVTRANDHSDRPVISANGRYVVFDSQASNLVEGDTNPFQDIFVRDLRRDRTVRITRAWNGEAADGASAWPSISSDGRFVVFNSMAGNLVPGDDNFCAIHFGGGDRLFPSALHPVFETTWPFGSTNCNDVFLHDRDTDGDGVFDEPGKVRTELISLSSSGEQGDAFSGFGKVSDDGRYVSFTSFASNFVKRGRPEEMEEITYVRDRRTGETVLVAADHRGERSTRASVHAAISGEGRHIVFASAAALTEPDTNNTADVFVRTRQRRW